MAKSNITIRDARIIFRDFDGSKNPYNNNRTFTVVLEDQFAEEVQADGWDVKWLEPRNEDETRLAVLKVTISFGEDRDKWPEVVMIENDKKKRLGPKNINILNWANFEHVDVKIRPYNWEFNGRTGVKAYLNALWVTIKEDDLEEKYRSIPWADDEDSDEDEEIPFG